MKYLLTTSLGIFWKGKKVKKKVNNIKHVTKNIAVARQQYRGQTETTKM